MIRHITISIRLTFLAKQECRLQILELFQFIFRLFILQTRVIIFSLAWGTLTGGLSPLCSNFFRCFFNKCIRIFILLGNTRYGVFFINLTAAVVYIGFFRPMNLILKEVTQMGIVLLLTLRLDQAVNFASWLMISRIENRVIASFSRL